MCDILKEFRLLRGASINRDISLTCKNTILSWISLKPYWQEVMVLGIIAIFALAKTAKH